MFQAVLPIRPVSLQKKGSKAKYQQKIVSIIQSRGYTSQLFTEGNLYARILWLHAQETAGDIDNIIKPILDSLKGHVFIDDRLIRICAVKAMNTSDFVLSDKYFENKVYDDFFCAIGSMKDHIVYVEVDLIQQHRPFFGQIDGGSHE